jgi:hypothetical protein
MATENPYVVTNKHSTKKEALVVFAHGFTGEQVTTWDGFEDLLQEDTELADHYFCFWGYPTELRLRYAITSGLYP